MTDSTSPVPPKEIERLLTDYAVAAQDGPFGLSQSLRFKIVELFASYTLSPEEARAVISVMDAAVVRNAAALHVDALDLGNGLVALRRIAASTEDQPVSGRLR